MAEAVAEVPSLTHVPLVIDAVIPASTPTAPPTSTATGTRKRHPVWRVARWPLLVIGLFLIGYVGWLAYTFIMFQQRIYVELPPTPTANVASIRATASAIVAQNITPEVEPTPDPYLTLPRGRINILVMGTDKRENDNDHTARSDTMLLVNLDTISRTVRIMTIPRDLVVDIPDYGKNKVNAAYLMGEYYQLPGGGQALAVRTVSEFFDVPIDYYVAINFQGFQKLVDTLGGIYINVPYEIDDPMYPSDDEGDPFGTRHVHFDPGWQYMDGKSALRYARTRHADNDFMRSKRQLQVIMAMREKAMSVDLLPSLPSIVNQLAGMLQTNIPFDKQMSLAQVAYQIEPSRIITSTIDNRMVSVMWLPDGSEGLRLDWKAARPMLNDFFGWSVSSPAASLTPTARPGRAGRGGRITPTVTRSATPIARRTQPPSRTPQAAPRRSPTRVPTATMRRSGALPEEGVSPNSAGSNQGPYP